MASRTELVYNSHFSLDTVETFMYRHSRDVMNRLRLSRILEEARRMARTRVPVYISDVDSLMMQYRRANGVEGRRFIGFEFKNMRADVGLRGSYVKVNGKQYELHYFMSDKAMMDFYYLIRVGRKYYLWNVRKAPVEFKWLGDRARGTYDYYALVHKDYVAELDEDELILFLAENVFG